MTRYKKTIKANIDKSPKQFLKESRRINSIHLCKQHVQSHTASAHHATHATEHSASTHTAATLCKGIDLVNEDTTSTPSLGFFTSGTHHHIYCNGIHPEEDSSEGCSRSHDNGHLQFGGDGFS